MGKKHSKATRKKISENKKAYFAIPENLEKRRQERIKWWKEHPEMVEKMREHSKRLWTDPESRAKMCAARKKACSKASYKKKYRETVAKMWADPEKANQIVENMRKTGDRKRALSRTRAQAKGELKKTPEYDVQSKFYQKEKAYLHQVCKEIMQPYGLEPEKYASYSYYEEIVEHFRPGWLALDRKRRYGGIDPLNPND